MRYDCILICGPNIGRLRKLGAQDHLGFAAG